MIKAIVPGSLMICGEHAVVYGQSALVCAVAQYVCVGITKRSDNILRINSALAQYEAPLSALKEEPKLRFVLAAVRRQLPYTGLDMVIESAIDPLLGFGSSAAVTVATLAALSAVRKKEMDNAALHRAAHEVILEIQKRGSGADLAASIWGGMLAYSPPPALSVQSLPLPSLSLSVRYAGYKTPTAEVLATLAAAAEEKPDAYAELYQRMGAVSQAAAHAAAQQNWQLFYQHLNAYQILMQELGVCDAVQAAHLAAVQDCAAAAKISGSGLGDCIIAFAERTPAQHQAVQIAAQGLRIIRNEYG